MTPRSRLIRFHRCTGRAPKSPGLALRRIARQGFCTAALLIGLCGAAAAEDTVKVAIGQRGGWEQCVSELGRDRGIFKRHGLAPEILYTQGSAETLQAVISNSIDIGAGLGTHATLGAFVKGAPVRAIGASFTSADEQFYYVPTDSPIRGIKDADGRSIAVSTTGAASRRFALALGGYFGVTLKPQPTGAYAATLTQTLTHQVDIGFSQAPFNLNYVDDGRIRIIARGSDVPELRDLTSRLIVVNATTLERRRDILKRFMAAYRETLDWLYADPQAIKAYAAWSGLPEDIAKRAPEFMTRHNMAPARIAGLDLIMRDAVQFKYIPAPLTEAQVKDVLQVDAVR